GTPVQKAGVLSSHVRHSNSAPFLLIFPESATRLVSTHCASFWPTSLPRALPPQLAGSPMDFPLYGFIYRGPMAEDSVTTTAAAKIQFIVALRSPSGQCSILKWSDAS